MKGFDDLNFDWKKFLQKTRTSSLNQIKDVFYWNYNKISPILEKYVHEHRQLPDIELKALINDFRLTYPIDKRNKELNGFYFDDLLGSLIKDFKKILANPIKMQILDLDFELVKNIESVRISKTASQEDENRNPILKKGSVYTQFKKIEPENQFDYFEDFDEYENAFNRFTKTDCLASFISDLKDFVKIYDAGNINAFEIELKKINDFITEANKIDLITEINKHYTGLKKNNLIEYSKLKNNYYKQKEFHGYNDFFDIYAKFIYSKYFMYKTWLEEKINDLKVVEHKKDLNNNYGNSYKINPVFKIEIIDEVYRVLKDHFRKEQQNELKLILENGSITSSKLYFMNNGNMLADCFKKLKESNFISNCDKKELEKWIFENFTYKNRRTRNETNFSLKTLQDIISNKYSKPHCKNPIIEINSGIIEKV